MLKVLVWVSTINIVARQRAGLTIYWAFTLTRCLPFMPTSYCTGMSLVRRVGTVGDSKTCPYHLLEFRKQGGSVSLVTAMLAKPRRNQMLVMFGQQQNRQWCAVVSTANLMSWIFIDRTEVWAKVHEHWQGNGMFKLHRIQWLHVGKSCFRPRAKAPALSWRLSL